MTAWELRWILLVVGGLILVAIYMFGRQHRKRVSRELVDEGKDLDRELDISLDPSAAKQEISLEGLSEELSALDEMRREQADERAVRAPPAVQPAPPPARPAPRPTSAPGQDPGVRVVVLHVAAARPHTIEGGALIEAIQQTELEFDEALGIFQRTVARLDGEQVVFGLANMVNPGTFDPQHLDGFVTPGVSLFMQLPGPIEGLKAFNMMLGCAQTLATALGLHVLDERRGVLSPQTIDHMREEIQLFSLRHEKRPAQR
jgi:cell division protein ZipA